MEQYKKIQSYANGGVVNKDEDDDSPIGRLSKSVKKAFLGPSSVSREKTEDETREEKYAKIRSDNRANFGYADGGIVQDSGLSPEEFEQHIKDLQNKGMKVQGIQGDDQLITAGLSKQPMIQPKPTPEQSLIDVNPDEKELENQFQNEEFVAQELADTTPKQVANMPEVDKEGGDALIDKATKVQVADNDPSSAARLMAALKPRTNELADAQAERDRNIALQQIEKGTALFGAGMARTNPDDVLKMIGEKDQHVGMPVKKYDEVISNQQNDPNSQVSQTMREYLTSKGVKVPNDASAASLFKIAPFLAKDEALKTAIEKATIAARIKAEEGEKNRASADERSKRSTDATLKAAQIRADAVKQNQANTQKRQSQRLSGQLVQRMNSDAIVKPSMQNLASLGKSKAILENKSVPLTPQLLADAEQDISSALTLRGMGATEGKIKRTELHTLGRQLAEAKQKYLNQPNIDLRKEEPELVKIVQQMNNALIEDYNTTIADRKHELASEFEAGYEGDEILEKTIGKYKKKEPKGASGLHKPGDVVVVKGKQYRVGEDGDSLEEM